MTTPHTTPKNLYQSALDSKQFSPDKDQALVVDAFEVLFHRLMEPKPLFTRLFHQFIASPPPIPGLYLVGGVGRGKTSLMDLFFELLPFPEKRRVHFYRFMKEVHDQLKTLKTRQNPLELIGRRIARQTKLLCFDELYVADIGDAMILAGLFTALVHNHVTLIITSNTYPDDLYRGGLQRDRFLPAIDLISHYTQLIDLGDSRDYRLMQLGESGVYFDLNDPETEARLESCFTQLSPDPHAEEGESVEILGRVIPVERSGDGIIWFTFEVLCGSERSQLDYIELSREYNTAIISGIPVLGAEAVDRARRLIELVDEFYDRGVKVIISAAAAPQLLYRGDRLAKGFARTASRLIEMQSSAYLSREHRP
ncbi:MAG: cell division protein ZapE [Arenicellales bacterium]|jgi:cell division protein ZapE|nr:cell division protein ZapE [Arenicellales bacterium]